MPGYRCKAIKPVVITPYRFVKIVDEHFVFLMLVDPRSQQVKIIQESEKPVERLEQL